MNYELTLKILFLLLLIPGIVGAILPILPGLVYMLIVSLIYGALYSFQILTLGELGILAGLTLLSFLTDFFSGIVGGKVGGASKGGLLWGMAGCIVGLLLFPPLGAFIGLFLGVLFAEFFKHRSPERALRGAAFSLLGKTFGIGINLFLAFVFFGFSIYFVFF